MIFRLHPNYSNQAILIQTKCNIHVTQETFVNIEYAKNLFRFTKTLNVDIKYFYRIKP